MKNILVLLAMLCCVLATAELANAVSPAQIGVAEPPHQYSMAENIVVTDRMFGGYMVEGDPNSVTYVSGSWKVPAVNCTPTDSQVLFWAGMDGVNNHEFMGS